MAVEYKEKGGFIKEFDWRKWQIEKNRSEDHEISPGENQIAEP